MPSPNPDRFLSFAEVAELIGLEVETIKKGKAGTDSIPRIKLGSRVVFSFNTIQEWMAAKAREAEEEQRRAELRKRDVLASISERRRAVNRTLRTIINGGKYR
jgi:predicted DNA-binding transcriptional regulator AlpA